MLLYHVTSAEAAREIYPDGPFVSKEADGSVYFSDRLHGYASGHGDAFVLVRVPESITELDDEFGTGERHYRINLRDLKPKHIVSFGMIKEEKQHG